MLRHVPSTLSIVSLTCRVCAPQDRKKYRGFTRSVTDLLRPSFPGTLPSVARNLFNAVFVVDLASAHGLR